VTATISTMAHLSCGTSCRTISSSSGVVLPRLPLQWRFHELVKSC